MNDEQLIELVRLYPVLYDISDAKYMNTTLKLKIWNIIGKQLNADLTSCKARWNNIRDNYRKSLKKSVIKNAQGAKRIKLYKYTEQLGFLTKFFDERDIKGSIESQKYEREEDEEQDEQDNKSDTGQEYVKQENEEVLIEVLQSTSSAFRDTNNKQDIKEVSTPIAEKQLPKENGLMEYLIRSNQATVAPLHPVDAFLNGIAPTLKTLCPFYLHLAKSEIFAAVQKYEMKMLLQQEINGIRTEQNSPTSHDSNETILKQETI